MRPTEIARRLDFSHDARPLVCWGAKGRRFNILPVLASALLFASVAAGQAEEPIRLHPDNPHFFLWRGQPTVLITAGEHYGAAMNLDFDYVRYLDELKANRFNLTRVFSGTYREVPGSFNITGNTLAPARAVASVRGRAAKRRAQRMAATSLISPNGMRLTSTD